MRILSILMLSAYIVTAQTKIDLKSQAKQVDFSQAESTKPFKTGNTLPPVCSSGEAFLLLSGPPGKNLYTCVSTNLWMTSLAQLPEGGANGEVLTWSAPTSEWKAATPVTGGTTLQIDGTTHGAHNALSYDTGSGMLMWAYDDGSAVHLTQAVNTAVMQTRANARLGGDMLLTVSSADGVQFLATMQPTMAQYSDGMVLQFRPARSCAGSPALDIDGLGVKSLTEQDGSTSMTCQAGAQYAIWYDAAGARWRKQ